MNEFMGLFTWLALLLDAELFVVVVVEVAVVVDELLVAVDVDEIEAELGELVVVAFELIDVALDKFELVELLVIELKVVEFDENDEDEVLEDQNSTGSNRCEPMVELPNRTANIIFFSCCCSIKSVP